MRLTNATPSPLETQRSLDVVRGKLEKRQKAPAEDVRSTPAPTSEAAVSAIPVARTSPAVSKTEQALQSQLIDSQRISQIAPIANSREPRPTTTVEAPPVAANLSSAPIETRSPEASKTTAPSVTAPVTTEKPQPNITPAQSDAQNNSASPVVAKNENTLRETAQSVATQGAGNTIDTQNPEQRATANSAQSSATARADTNLGRANNNRQQTARNTQPPAIEREYQEALRTPNARQQVTEPLREATATRNQVSASQTRVEAETNAQAPTSDRPRTEPVLATASVSNTRSTTQSPQATQDSERQQNQNNNKTAERTVPVETRAPINASQQAITQYQASQSLLQDASSTTRVRTTA